MKCRVQRLLVVYIYSVMIVCEHSPNVKSRVQRLLVVYIYIVKIVCDPTKCYYHPVQLNNPGDLKTWDFVGIHNCRLIDVDLWDT